MLGDIWFSELGEQRHDDDRRMTCSVVEDLKYEIRFLSARCKSGVLSQHSQRVVSME